MAPHHTRALRRLLAAAALLALLAPALAAAQDAPPVDFRVDGEGFTVDDGEGALVVRDEAGAVVRELEAPVNWRADAGPWTVEHYEVGSGKRATALVQTPPDGAPRGFVFLGRGDLARDALIWTGVRDPLYGNLVAPATLGADTELVQLRPDLRVPDCDGLTRPLAMARLDPDGGAFTRPVDPPPDADALAAAPLETALDARLSAPLNRQVLTQSAAARNGGAVAPPAQALFDGDPATSLVLEPGRDILVLEVYASFQPRALALVPADEDAARALAGGALTVQVDAGGVHPVTAEVPGALQLPLEQRCVIVRATKRIALADLALLADVDLEPLDQALARTVEAALDVPDDTRLRALTEVIAAHEAAALEPLLAAAARATSADDLERLLGIAERLSERSAAKLALAIAARPDADSALLERTTAVLRRYPKVAAAALEERIAALEPGTDEHLVVAQMLASLPVSGSLAALLRELDRSRDDDARAERVLDSLAAVGPRLVGVVTPYLVREELDDDTRIALMRAMLRVAPAWHEAMDPDQAAGEAVQTALAPIAAMLAREPVAVRLLGVKNAGAYRVAAAAEPLSALAATDPVDIVRAEAVTALAGLAPGHASLAPVLAALADAAPSVRIAAASALARPELAREPGVADALRASLETELWPEALVPALAGLTAAQHPESRAIAEAWLGDPERGGELHAVAAAAIVADPQPTPWPTLETWLADATLERRTRRLLLADWLGRADTDLERGISLARSRLAANDADATEDAEAWRRDAIETVLVALEARAPERLDALLPELLAAGGTSDPALLPVVDLMGYHDTPQIRAALEALAERGEAELAAAARDSLRRLAGEPLYDTTVPIDDLPEL